MQHIFWAMKMIPIFFREYMTFRTYMRPLIFRIATGFPSMDSGPKDSCVSMFFKSSVADGSGASKFDSIVLFKR